MKNMLVALAVVGIGVGSVTAYTHATRSDCPGKIACPLTGQVICKDKCPAKK